MREAAATEIRRAITGTQPRREAGVSSCVRLACEPGGGETGASPCPCLSRKRAEKANFTCLLFGHVCGWVRGFCGFGWFFKIIGALVQHGKD